VRLLARTLDRSRYRIEVIPCFRKEGMPDQSHDQLRALGVHVGTTAYGLNSDETVDYLRRNFCGADIVISSKDVANIYPALERLAVRPPLIEHGGLVSEALSGPKHFTTRYVGVCASIRAAAAGRIDPAHAVEIPSMVDLSEFDPAARGPLRAALGIADGQVLIGRVGRLESKKRVENFIPAAAVVAGQAPAARYVVVGGPDALMPEYAHDLHRLSENLGLGERLIFTSDRTDVPALISAPSPAADPPSHGAPPRGRIDPRVVETSPLKPSAAWLQNGIPPRIEQVLLNAYADPVEELSETKGGSGS